ncbi:CCR4-NOT transcription complex subunit [Trichostrongylus colubriformis]|uniref:CCR4-NOT transcription complex subunit n=1 Tax=Trichostrongylus colubriformis TaxID=6319 RepID=A0AAN8F3U5_TRICO
MSIGLSSPARYSLSYVDSLLTDFTQYPQKSIQFVFQRLLVTCGADCGSPAVHCARVLLSAVGFGQPLPPGPRRSLDESTAAQLIFLIVKFATEEQPSRSVLELAGARHIFNALTDRVSAELQDAEANNDSQLPLLVQSVSSKVLPSASDIQLCLFWVSVTPGKAASLINPFIGQLLHNFFVIIVSSKEKTVIRTEFVIRCITAYLEGDYVGTPLVTFLRNHIAEDKKHIFNSYLGQVLAKAAKFSAEVDNESLITQVEQLCATGTYNSAAKKALFESSNMLLVGVVQGAGSSCTATEETFRSRLQDMTMTEAACFTPSTVALALISFLDGGPNKATLQAKRHASFERAGPGVSDLDVVEDPPWNGKVFANVVNEMNPNLDWCEVIDRLDDVQMLVTRRQSLITLIDALKTGLRDKPFPINKLYTKWRCREAQLSLISSMIENPDIFCIADYPHRAVPTSMLKNTPDESDRLLAPWCCVELTELLLAMAGEQNVQTAAIRLLHGALEKWPDVVLLALFQVPPPMTDLRQKFIEMILPVFIHHHTNAVSVLNAIWNSEVLPRTTVHNMIINAFLAFHSKAPDDQQRLARILDIANELKPGGLAELFSCSHVPFIIEMGLLASKRDYLKLDKWLEDKFAELGEPLVDNVIAQLQRRLFVPATSQSLSPETFSIMMTFVRNHSAKLTPLLKQKFIALTEKLKEIQQQQMRESSARSSSVSSTGRSPIVGGFGMDARFPGRPPGAGGPPPQTMPPPPQPFPPNGAGAPPPPHNLLAMQAGPQQPVSNPVGLGSMFGNSAFGGSQDLLRSSHPGANQPFGGQPMAMSPSSQMMRSGMPPAPQRQNSASGVGWQMQGPGQQRGPPTPNQQMDFQPQPPPTSSQVDLRSAPMPLGAGPVVIDDMNFPKDVQDEANMYFEQIYNQSSLVGDLIMRLKGLKMSQNPRDQKVLACVVKNLFEEYRFFHEYPERELRTTAEIYGGIIREGIISNLHFATAVRKVIESLQSEVGSMLWTFGIVSLTACRSKLCSYPKVCSMIAQHENFSKFPQGLKEYVLAGLKGELPGQSMAPPPMDSSGRATPPLSWTPAQRSSSTESAKATSSSTSVGSTNRTGNSVLSYTNVDTLVSATEKEGAEVAQPDVSVVDKVLFLFNNLSQSNLTTKKDEILALIDEYGEPFIRWFAQYVVMKRVSIEQNFLPLYNQFVQAINHPLLDAHIKRETFRNIRILLRSDKRQAASNYSDRQLLKNLGMWLGSITIARNKPILIHELDLKALLMEAYYKGQQELLFVVPFIAKILFSCGKTQLFSATCAWIRSILKVLAELHNEPDLKINLKFEIEVLCKELSVDLESLPVEGLLKDTDRLVRVTQQLSDLKTLSQPDQANSSPVPGQMRLASDAVSAPGADTKPSTPNPESEGSSAIVDGTASAVIVPPLHFAYHDINVTSYEGLIPHIKFQLSLPLFQLHPQMKHHVRPALTQAIKELIGPVAERALKIAMIVTETLVRKDFALDPDENNLKKAAFHMMRAMTAGMAMITCRDPLAGTMASLLQQSFTNSLRTSNSELSKMIDEAARAITQDNIELTTNFIVKTACEKAAAELEKRLDAESARRVAARREGTEWHDATMEKIQAELPPRIAIQVGPTRKEHLAIYEQFSGRICGFKPTISEDTSASVMETVSRAMTLPETAKEVEQLTQQLNSIIKEVDITMQAQPNPSNKAYQGVGAIRDLLSQLASNPRDSMTVVNLITRSVEYLLHAYHVDSTSKALDVEWARRLRDLFLGVCRVLLTQFTLVDLSRRITGSIVNVRMDYKWNVEAIEVLLKHQLVQTQVFDQHLAHVMDGGSNAEATLFAQRFFRVIGSNDASRIPVIKEAFPATYEQLLKMQQVQAILRQQAAAAGGTAEPNLDSPLGPAAMDSLVTSSPAATGVPASVPPSAEEPGMSDKVEIILREWIGLCYTPMAQRNPKEALFQMIVMMHEHGVLSGDEKISQFIRMCTEMCVDVALRLLKTDATAPVSPSNIVRQRCYYTLDAFVKLMALMIKYSDGGSASPSGTSKIALLKKVLHIITSVLHVDHEVRRAEFNAMPYHRILITLFIELTTPDGSNLEPIAWSIIEAFGQNALFMLQPRRCPSFAYAWLDFVGHRAVIGALLGGNGFAESVDPMKTSAMYTQLLICHLKFLAPFLRNIQLPKSIAVLYKGTLRVLLVILHDFPELLCEYHYVIIDTIPPNCVQLRNLVLSAYPRNMRLPDPFALNFKQVDSIPEMAIEPKSNLNMASIIPDSIRLPLDAYLKTRSAVDFLSALPGMLQISETPGSKYNSTVMNAMVLYVGMKAIESLHERRQRISIHTIAHTAFMDIFQNLAVQLCTEGRYLLFNAIANQLRYPNAHTHYFSCVFLFLFLNSDHDAIQEQITRILFERLVALRPHPMSSPGALLKSSDYFKMLQTRVLRRDQPIQKRAKLKVNEVLFLTSVKHSPVDSPKMYMLVVVPM